MNETTGPVWDAVRNAGIQIEQAPDGWTYEIEFASGTSLSGGGYESAVAALQAALHLLVGNAGRAMG